MKTIVSLRRVHDYWLVHACHWKPESVRVESNEEYDWPSAVHFSLCLHEVARHMELIPFFNLTYSRNAYIIQSQIEFRIFAMKLE